MFIYIYLYLDIFISKIRQDGTSASLIKKIHVFSLLEMKQDHKPKSWPPKKSKLILLDFSFFLSFQNFFLFNLKKKKSYITHVWPIRQLALVRHKCYDLESRITAQPCNFKHLTMILPSNVLFPFSKTQQEDSTSEKKVPQDIIISIDIYIHM